MKNIIILVLSLTILFSSCAPRKSMSRRSLTEHQSRKESLITKSIWGVLAIAVVTIVVKRQ